MTDTYSGAAPGGYTDDRSTTGVVAEQAGAVKDEALEAGARVVDITKEKTGEVVDEAKAQVSDLLHQTQAELREQAAVQQQRVADGLQAVSDELNEMARNSSGGLAADLVSRASSRTGKVASYLDARDPGSLLSELKSYAARKPGAFIAAAVVAGAVAGRLTRSLASGTPDDQSHDAATGADDRPEGLAPVHPPELRRPTTLNASTSSQSKTDAGEATTPLYSALLTDRDDATADDQNQNPDVLR